MTFTRLALAAALAVGALSAQAANPTAGLGVVGWFARRRRAA